MQCFDSLRRSGGVELAECIKAIRKYTKRFIIPPPVSPRPARTHTLPPPRIITLSTATIIVCPPGLVQQWIAEISQHTERDSLKLLLMDSPQKRLPPTEALLEYDVVLFSRAMFDNEAADNSHHASSDHTYAPNYSTSGIQRGRRSPLRDIYWKRIIVDEV
jgi:hypothetical protein